MTSQFTKCRCLHSHWCLPVAPWAPCRLENMQLPGNLALRLVMQIIRIMLSDLAGTLA